MYVYTIVITACKIGVIWTRNQIVRKSLQSLSSMVFMIMIIEINNKKYKVQESYDRKKNRELYAKSECRSKDA